MGTSTNLAFVDCFKVLFDNLLKRPWKSFVRVCWRNGSDVPCSMVLSWISASFSARTDGSHGVVLDEEYRAG